MSITFGRFSFDYGASSAFFETAHGRPKPIPTSVFSLIGFKQPNRLALQRPEMDYRKYPAIDHRKYAGQYVFWACTCSRFALRFAPSYANLVRTRRPASYQNLWLPGAGFHCGFQGFSVVSTGNQATLVVTIQISIESDAQYSPRPAQISVSIPARQGCCR